MSSHWKLEKENVGEVIGCTTRIFRRGRCFFRPDLDGAQWTEITPAQLKAMGPARNPQEAMAAIRGS